MNKNNSMGATLSGFVIIGGDLENKNFPMGPCIQKKVVDYLS